MLAVRIERAAFDTILADAVHSSFDAEEDVEDEVVLVGAEPWFLRDATGDQAAAAASATGR